MGGGIPRGSCDCKVPAAGRNTPRIRKGFTRTLGNEATFLPLSRIAATLRSPFER